MNKSERWVGRPRWNGKIADVDLNECLIPFVQGQPFLVLLEDCDDWFLPIFTSPEMLGAVTMKIMVKTGLVDPATVNEVPFDIKQITDAGDFIDSVREGGVRIMLNPQIINDHHTKWLEVVKAGEEYKFKEMNNAGSASPS